MESLSDTAQRRERSEEHSSAAPSHLFETVILEDAGSCLRDVTNPRVGNIVRFPPVADLREVRLAVHRPTLAIGHHDGVRESHHLGERRIWPDFGEGGPARKLDVQEGSRCRNYGRIFVTPVAVASFVRLASEVEFCPRANPDRRSGAPGRTFAEIPLRSLTQKDSIGDGGVCRATSAAAIKAFNAPASVDVEFGACPRKGQRSRVARPS